MTLGAFVLLAVVAPAAARLCAPASPGRYAVQTSSSRLLQLRGGVRSLDDIEEWEAVQVNVERGAYPPPYPSAPSPKPRLDPKPSAQVEAADKLLVVDFTAVWCGPCQRIAPAFAALAEEFADSALFVKVDVDRLGELAAQLGVTSMPTFLFFRGGEVIDTMRGADEAGLRALVVEHATPTPVAA